MVKTIVHHLGLGDQIMFDETSLMLHLAPGLVDMSTATRNVPASLADNEHVRFGGNVGFGWLSNDFGPDGHIGDPTGATVERGEQIYAAAVDTFCAVLGEISAFELPMA